MSAFVAAGSHFEKWATDLLALARKERHLPRRAALVREAAHYLDCAARLVDGVEPYPLSIKGQRAKRRRDERAFLSGGRVRHHG